MIVRLSRESGSNSCGRLNCTTARRQGKKAYIRNDRLFFIVSGDHHMQVSDDMGGFSDSSSSAPAPRPSRDVTVSSMSNRNSDLNNS